VKERKKEKRNKEKEKESQNKNKLDEEEKNLHFPLERSVGIPCIWSLYLVPGYYGNNLG
jgi:hypothetical protein